MDCARMSSGNGGRKRGRAGRGLSGRASAEERYEGKVQGEGAVLVAVGKF